MFAFHQSLQNLLQRFHERSYCRAWNKLDATKSSWFCSCLRATISARKFDSQESLRLGFVSEVFPDDTFMQKVNEYAVDLARNVSPRSIRVIKSQLYAAQFQSLTGAIETGNSEMLKSFESEDFAEGVAHFIEKRSAKFSGQ